ncbi:hypothetical protein FHT40_006119 [Mycolicibacterium sp. BK556]|uniref:hypothetical protein n=1 Tax=unclassified Mycolicibacterium TaxID=2636767 RepID=UPI00160972AF|nr:MULTISPECIES: hypothetical protein [unclassified Mycolicibacterium]MBB3606428.1 hypothetical protein [Mycolicibacterium sp. BK556]MBB3636326.1 hypothetical protein [Mycolicibacterium sp. BK607]
MVCVLDRFDDVRRRWIARHQRSFLFQKRRAELLARTMRDRAGERSGARVDPADDDVMHPLLLRGVHTSYAAVDALIVGILALLAPVGWPAGRLLYGAIVRLVPATLRSYPVAALLWAAVIAGVPMPMLYTPGPTLGTALVAPWLLAQLPATLLAAGIYGIVEGWLAVDGARDWWPMRPLTGHDTVDFGWAADDLTGPGVFAVAPPDPAGERTPSHRDTRDG